MTNYKNKKIGILGLGMENIAVVLYMKDKGAKITICDQIGEKEELKSYLDKLKGQDYTLRLGENYLDNLTDFDIVFRTPGLPYLNKKIQEAKEKGVEISSQIKLFFQNCPSPIIGVTGTKGKGTTTMLIGDILKKAIHAKDTRSYFNQVYMAGNIGRAPIEFLENLESKDIVILELSSFMLQDLNISPHIAVVLDIKSDHLDYHQNQQEYVLSKENIVKYQTKKDFACINSDYAASLDFSSKTQAEVFWFSRQKSVEQGAFAENDEIILRFDGKNYPICKTSEVTLRGQHNLENICAAAIATHLAGVDRKTITQVVKSFKGLEHRLEFVGKVSGVKYYNDSFSTTPDTAIAAIKSFSEPIILIAGGSEKNADYTELGQVINNSNVKTAILIGETGPRIKSKIHFQASISNSKLKVIDDCRNLKDVMMAVHLEAKSGDIVLLSPASASFDWFSSYKERGKLFKKWILKELA